jgi:hypothetical protein
MASSGQHMSRINKLSTTNHTRLFCNNMFTGQAKMVLAAAILLHLIQFRTLQLMALLSFQVRTVAIFVLSIFVGNQNVQRCRGLY